MNSARPLLAAIIEDDVTAEGLCEELKLYDFEVLERRPVDLDGQFHVAPADMRLEYANVLWRPVIARAALEHEAGIRIEGVALEPIADIFLVFGRDRGNIENAGRKNQGSRDRTRDRRDLDLDSIGSPDIRLATAQGQHEKGRRAEREETSRPEAAQIGLLSERGRGGVVTPIASRGGVQFIPFGSWPGSGGLLTSDVIAGYGVYATLGDAVGAGESPVNANVKAEVTDADEPGRFRERNLDSPTEGPTLHPTCHDIGMAEMRLRRIS